MRKIRLGIAVLAFTGLAACADTNSVTVGKNFTMDTLRDTQGGALARNQTGDVIYPTGHPEKVLSAGATSSSSVPEALTESILQGAAGDAALGYGASQLKPQIKATIGH